MAISMYQACAPVLARGLTNLAGILRKGEAHAEAKKIDPSVLLGMRLAPDMFALGRQVQVASDTAKGCLARLAGMEPPAYEDNEQTFAQYIARLDKTLAYVNGFQAGQIDGSEERTVVLKMRSGELTFKGQEYLLGFVLPNFFFHVTTAYDILRHAGVELGKRDYLGAR